MKQYLCLLVIGIYCILGVCSSNSSQVDPSLGKRGNLLLTPLLKKGDYKAAQQRSRVTPSLGDVPSFSGFLTVDEECGSNLFFWFFPAEKSDWKDAPLVLWIEGNIDLTPMPTILEGIGPFRVYNDRTEKNKFAWNQENNILFIDQPVQVGFSYTGKCGSPVYAADAAKHLYEAVLQIHKLFPELQGNKFIIAGEERYSSHFITSLGYTIHKQNPSAEIKINLSAMMIGNSWMDIVVQSDFGDFLYQHGLVDAAGKKEYDHFYSECKKVNLENYDEFFRYCRDLTIDIYYKYVGNVDILQSCRSQYDESRNFRKYLHLPTTREALHLGNLLFRTDFSWENNESMKDVIEQLLEEYPIIFYNGQLDIKSGYPMMINFLRSLSWSGQDKYLSSTRTKWCRDKDTQVGYYTGSHHLYDVLVLGAGNRVSRHQPQVAFQLLSSILSGTKDDPLHSLTDCQVFDDDSE